MTLLLCLMATCCVRDSDGNTILFYSLCGDEEKGRNKQKKQTCGLKGFWDRERCSISQGGRAQGQNER